MGGFSSFSRPLCEIGAATGWTVLRLAPACLLAGIACVTYNMLLFIKHLSSRIETALAFPVLASVKGLVVLLVLSLFHAAQPVRDASRIFLSSHVYTDGVMFSYMRRNLGGLPRTCQRWDSRPSFMAGKK